MPFELRQTFTNPANFKDIFADKKKFYYNIKITIDKHSYEVVGVYWNGDTYSRIFNTTLEDLT